MCACVPSVEFVVIVQSSHLISIHAMLSISKLTPPNILLWEVWVNSTTMGEHMHTHISMYTHLHTHTCCLVVSSGVLSLHSVNCLVLFCERHNFIIYIYIYIYIYGFN